MRSVIALLGLGLVAFFVLAVVADVQATTYYVSPGGSDANTGTSAAAAFRTIKKAAKVIESGDTVYVAAGTYTDEIVVNGVQDSSTPAVFIGNSGATVSTRWKVANSNYVQIEGFTFQGTSSRFLVWQGSYEGRIEDCQFSAGDEGMLIKSGSLTIDNCLIENFTHDGIQVDGEADVLVKDSTISGCQDAGMEIRKVARVEFNNCTVSGQVGDGIEVNVVADSIDGGFTSEDLISGPIPLAVSDGPVTFNPQTLLYGDLYHRQGVNPDPSHVSGTLNELPPGALSPVDPGDAATNNNNANIPLSDANKPVLINGDQFDLGSNDGVDLAPGIYYFSQMVSKSDLRVSGTTIVYVTGQVDIKGVVNPAQDSKHFQLYGMGPEVKINSQAAVYAAIYAPTTTVRISGGSEVHGMVVGGSLDLSGQAKIHTDESLTDLALSLINLPPTTPLPVGWTPVASGELDVKQSTLSDNNNAVSFETAQTFDAQSTQFSSNAAWGLRLQGDVELTNCTVDGNATGGLRLKDVTDTDLQIVNLALTDNVQYGVYAESSQLTFDSSNSHHWAISGSQIAIAGVGSDLTFDTFAISGGSTAGVQLSQGTMNATSTTFSGSGYGLAVDDSDVTLTSCTLSGNTVGLYANQNATVDAIGTNINSNTSWGAEVYASAAAGAKATFSGCTLSGNLGGIKVVDAADGDFEMLNTVIQNNTQDGLRFENCNLTLGDQATANWQILNNPNGIYSSNSTLTLDNVTLGSSSTAAVHAVGGNLTVSNSTLSSSGYGIWADTVGAVVMDTCTLSGNTTGLYANQNTSLQVTNATFTGSTQWGASVTPKTAGGLSVIFDACTFHSNAGGVSLVNAIDGQVSLRTGTLIRDNTNSGLHFENGNLTINDQAGGTAWRTLRNGYGISGNGSTLTLSNVSVEESSLYGVYCEDSSVSLANCTVTGVGGVYADAANDSLTVDSTRFDASSAGGWGVARYGGDLDVKNCVLNGFDGGVYLSTAFSGDQAAVKNSTLVNLANNGVYLADGDATVQNTVLIGGSSAQGLTQVSGQLTHSHNLLNGFGTPFSGTTVDASELLANPRFVDAANGDFQLAKGSPAINSGTDLTVSVTADMLGNARPSHKVFEIGAYEYMPNGGSLRVLKWKESQ